MMRYTIILTISTLMLVGCDDRATLEYETKADAQSEAAEDENADDQSDAAERTAKERLRSWASSSLAEVTRAADAGDADAQYELGQRYARGMKVTKDEAVAVTWYRKAAKQGHAQSQMAMAYSYARGSGVTKDNAASAEWFRRAAEQGNAEACLVMAWRYKRGSGVEPNEERAFHWFQRAAELWDVNAYNELGRCYAGGIGTSANRVLAYRWYFEQSQYDPLPWLGDEVSEAKKQLGVLDTQMTAEQIAEAKEQGLRHLVRLSRKKAAAGDIEGMEELGFCYARGLGVAKNPKVAIRWFRKVAEDYRYPNSMPNALCALGDCQLQVEGEHAIIVDAYAWYFLAHLKARESATNKLSELERKMTAGQVLQAKKQADDFAEHLYHKERASAWGSDPLYDRAESFYRGQGVPQDLVQAYQWFYVTTEHDACNTSGLAARTKIVLLDAELTPAQLTQARAAGQTSSAELYRQKAETGDAYMQYLLAPLYANGKGVPKDLVQARKWYYLAESGFYSKAVVDSLEAQMTPEQIALAKKLADEFKPLQPMKTDDKKND